MIASKPGQCAGQVYDGLCRFYSCTRKPTLQEEGKDWCWQHAPSAEAERKQKASERFQKQVAADNKRWEEKEKREARAEACMAALDGRDPAALRALEEAAENAITVLGKADMVSDYELDDARNELRAALAAFGAVSK